MEASLLEMFTLEHTYAAEPTRRPPPCSQLALMARLDHDSLIQINND